ncbi:TorF family putative porin [Glaciimonas sp. GG7]
MKNLTYKLILATAVASTLVTGFAYADDAAPVVAAADAAAPAAAEPVPDNVIAYNIGAVNDYRFRGISQTRFDPAVQGGVDYTNNPTGLYAGTWLSNIKWIKDSVNAGGVNGKGNIEWDLYAGQRGDLPFGFTYDVGGLYYYYPGNNLNLVAKNADTFELYAQLGYGPGYFKYSQALTNAFGAPNSKNSAYYDLGANFDVGSGITLGLHFGHQTIANASFFSYNDWKIGVTKTFDSLYGVTLGAAFIGTDAKKGAYAAPDGKNLGKNGVVFSLAKTF